MTIKQHNSTRLSADVLARLRDNKRFLESSNGPTRDPHAMAETARFFGIKKRPGIDWWNETINALDEYAPNWRGYPAPKVNKRITYVLSNSSERDAA